MSIKVYRGHALAPTEGADRVREIIRLGGRYYNLLIEIERRRHARYALIRRDFAPELAALEDEWTRLDAYAAELITEIKRSRQAHWRATKEHTLKVPHELADKLEATKTSRKLAGAEAKPLRAAFAVRLAPGTQRYQELTAVRGNGCGPRRKEHVNAEVLAELLADPTTDAAWKRVRESDATALAEAKNARSACGLPPGTYLLIEQAVDKAKKDSLPAAPRFRAHRGEGRVGVQLHKTSFADLHAGTSTFFRLTPAPRRADKTGRQDCIYTASIRTGSHGRAPIWATFSVRLHRAPPADAAIKWAWFTVRRRGERWCYELQLVCQHESFGESSRPVGVGHGGHVHIGWSQTETGVRVARLGDAVVEVPERMLARAEHAEELTAFASNHYNQVKHVLALWLRGQEMRWDRMQKDADRLKLRAILVAWAEHTLGGPDGVRKLWGRWKHARLDARCDLFASVGLSRRWLRGMQPRSTTHAALAWWCYTWTRKDAHLRQWAADDRVRFERQRDALFRSEAIRLATQHETLSVDAYSIAAMTERPDTESGEAANMTAQHNAHLAAPGRFREILIDVMGSRCTPRERLGAADVPGTARKRERSSKSTPVTAAVTPVSNADKLAVVE